MANNEFFDKTESLDDKYLAALNERTHWFTELKRQHKYSTIDYEGTDKKGRKCWIELKTREHDESYFSTWFIEEKKWNELERVYKEDGTKPLYINFFKSADSFIIWNLQGYFDGVLTMPELKQVLIDNKGYNRTEIVNRYHLKPREGNMYRFDYETNKYKKVW